MNGSGELWSRSSDVLREKVGRSQFNMWFQNVRVDRGDDGKVVVEAQDQFQADWIRTNYLPLLRQTFRQVSENDVEVEIALSKPAKKKAEDGQATIPFPPLKKFDDRVTWNYTFDTFIVGNSNQFAHASAQAVAAEPGKKYNPLLIYGGVGLGKTHLIHAIGNYLGSQTSLNTQALTSQNFEHEFLSHVRNGTLDEFRAKYRKADVLLIDDIHFWARKEGTQAEFYSVFNTLFDRRRQMVFTSDRPPSEVPDLDERLISRFTMGLIADIQPPDIETKVAILQKKAETFKVTLPEDVAFYLAGRVNSNIRDLEGCLMRLAAHQTFTHEELTLDNVKASIESIVPGRREKPTAEELIKVVAHEAGLKLSDVKGERRVKSIAFSRQVAMYFLRTLLEMSLPEIGHLFGGKDHSTVLHACRKIEKMSTTDDKTKQFIHRIRRSIGYA